MSNTTKITEWDDLLSYIEQSKPEFIVVEGYNGVGKSKVIDYLYNNVTNAVYRPNYNSWSNLVPREYRWAIFSSFLDIVSSVKVEMEGSPIIFDRGFFSGAVYNNDIHLSKYYDDIVKNCKVLHILVSCSREDYEMFLNIRNSSKELSYDDCLTFTERYRNSMEIAGATYIEFINAYSSSLDKSGTCASCSHYSIHDSKCNHPYIKDFVHPDKERCEYSSMKEVQDGELQSV